MVHRSEIFFFGTKITGVVLAFFLLSHCVQLPDIPAPELAQEDRVYPKLVAQSTFDAIPDPSPVLEASNETLLARAAALQKRADALRQERF